MNSQKSEKRHVWRHLLTALCAITVGMLAITSQSLWMDEGGTAFRAMIPGLEDWWKMLLHLRGSEVQMPIYMLYAWSWVQSGGAVNEYVLRMSNLPWLVIAVLALARVRFWPMVCLLSPFVWYYVGEFRPYAMHLAAGACAAAAIGKVIRSRAKQEFDGVHAICGACLFLILCSLTGAVWAAGTALCALVLRPDWLSRRGFWLRSAPWLAVALAAAGYYTYTILEGYRAIAVQDAGFLNLMFGIYEMMGLLGLGPGKEELRRDVWTIVNHLWILAPAAACIAGAWICGVFDWALTVPRRVLLATGVAIGLPLLTLAICGVVMDFRVLGRHLSPALPAILLPLAHALTIRGRWRRLSIALAASACFFLTLSCLGLRFLERHARDDYRRATHLVIKALSEGKRVWWQADMNAPRYYAFRQGGFPMIGRIQELESDIPSSPMFADVIFVNRPDVRVFHTDVDYQTHLKRNYFKLQEKFRGFEVWTNE